jgi:hypothetical protein
VVFRGYANPLWTFKRVRKSQIFTTEKGVFIPYQPGFTTWDAFRDDGNMGGSVAGLKFGWLAITAGKTDYSSKLSDWLISRYQ